MSTSGRVRCSGVEKYETANLSTVDFSGLNPRVKTRPLVVEDIGKACRDQGSFKVINHGISESVISGALEVASEFFALPEEQKKEFASEDIHRPVRYGVCSRVGGVTSPRDFLKQYAHPLDEWIKFWPHSPPDYREKMGKYAMEVKRVGLQLMDAILESLGLNPTYMKSMLEEGMQLMTVNNYEMCPQLPGSVTGLAPHSDYGCLTILLQGCDGLQVVDKNSNTWKFVPVEFPYALHVHLGDCLEVLSNGWYKSVIHRVILNGEKRMSIASIHGFPMDEKVTAAKELVDDQHPKRYKESSFREFLAYISSHDFTNGDSFIDSLRIDYPSA